MAPAAPPPSAHRLRHWARTHPGVLAAGAYLGVVGSLEVLRRGVIALDPDVLASSPAGVAAGNLWSLLTSGLLVDGAPAPQIVGLAVVAALVIWRLGAATFWRAALLGHLGSALLVYLGVAAVAGLGLPSVDGVLDQPDYGVSCVAAGALGALVAATLRSGRRRRWGIVALAGSLGAIVAALPAADGLAGVEHLVAFALGAAAGGL